MKTKFRFCIILITISMIGYQGCKDEEENAEPELKIMLSEPTDVKETSFVANWSVNKPGISSAKIELSLTYDFSDIFKSVTISDPSNTRFCRLTLEIRMYRWETGFGETALEKPY